MSLSDDGLLLIRDGLLVGEHHRVDGLTFCGTLEIGLFGVQKELSEVVKGLPESRVVLVSSFEFETDEAGDGFS